MHCTKRKKEKLLRQPWLKWIFQYNLPRYIKRHLSLLEMDVNHISWIHTRTWVVVLVVVIPAVQSVSALGSDGHTSKALCWVLYWTTPYTHYKAKQSTIPICCVFWMEHAKKGALLYLKKEYAHPTSSDSLFPSLVFWEGLWVPVAIVISWSKTFKRDKEAQSDIIFELNILFIGHWLKC